MTSPSATLTFNRLVTNTYIIFYTGYTPPARTEVLSRPAIAKETKFDTNHASEVKSSCVLNVAWYTQQTGTTFVATLVILIIWN